MQSAGIDLGLDQFRAGLERREASEEFLIAADIFDGKIEPAFAQLVEFVDTPVPIEEFDGLVGPDKVRVLQAGDLLASPSAGLYTIEPIIAAAYTRLS